MFCFFLHLVLRFSGCSKDLEQQSAKVETVFNAHVSDAEAWMHGGTVACVDYSRGCAAWLQEACSAFSITEWLLCSCSRSTCTNASLSVSEKCTLRDEMHLNLWGGCVFMHRHTKVAKTLQGTAPPALGWFKKQKGLHVFNKINHTNPPPPKKKVVFSTGGEME